MAQAELGVGIYPVQEAFSPAVYRLFNAVYFYDVGADTVFHLLHTVDIQQVPGTRRIPGVFGLIFAAQTQGVLAQ